LLLDKLVLSSDDLLLSLLHVLLSLLSLHFVALVLDLMGSSVILLLGKLSLNLLLVQKIGGVFESQWKGLVKDLSVVLNLLSVSILELSKSLRVLLLGLEEILVPLLVELLILLDVSLLAVLSLLSLLHHLGGLLSLVILDLELIDSVLSHLGLNVFSFHLTSESMLIKDLKEILDVVVVWFLK